MKYLQYFFIAVCMMTVSVSSYSLENTTIDGMAVLEWDEIAPGVWSAQIGQKEGLTFRDFAGGAPKVKAMEAMGNVKFPFEQKQSRGQVVGQRTSVRLPLGVTEQVYGWGCNSRI